MEVYNYGIKETTSIQTGRRGTDAEQGWSHTYVWWIKTQEGYFESKESQPHTRPPSPRFQCQEDKFP